MAEREGFEPSIPFVRYTRLAGERLRPLGHLSAMDIHQVRLREEWVSRKTYGEWKFGERTPHSV